MSFIEKRHYSFSCNHLLIHSKFEPKFGLVCFFNHNTYLGSKKPLFEPSSPRGDWPPQRYRI